MRSNAVNGEQIRQSVRAFVATCHTGTPGEYTFSPGGQVTLYASCFAAMTLHYLGLLSNLPTQERQAWVAYINTWQDPETGLFIGPELAPEELRSPKHTWEHLTLHLTAHALPALHVLGGRPAHPLRFAQRFLDQDILRAWLNQRNWHNAWFEGNNLLFVGQFLVYLRDFERRPAAWAALDTFFNWLDAQQDPATGLWGTNGYCDAYAAVYGGYHQLLVYYYCGRPVRYTARIIDTTLCLQHEDGSFTRHGGGGACEDADAVDILVNLYKRTGYRTRAIQRALHRAITSILRQQMPSGGFVYRRKAPFTYMGMARTATPADTAHLFATWFRVHTLALACQVLHEHPLAQADWQFNNTCSMGWHACTPLPQPLPDPWLDLLPIPRQHLTRRLRRLRPIAMSSALHGRISVFLRTTLLQPFSRQ